MRRQILSVENLGFAYQHNNFIFKNLSFALMAGDVLYISGPNGSGKTTLLKVLAGFYQASEGQCQRPDELEYIASDFNGHFLHLTAPQNLKFWGQLRHHSFQSAQIDEILQLWQLSHPLVKRLPVIQFSTGMRRKLALARLNLTTAQLWILDEPILGLDKQACGIFHDILQKHIQNGGGCILTSHETKSFESLISNTVHIEGLNT